LINKSSITIRELDSYQIETKKAYRKNSVDAAKHMNK